MTSSTHPKSGFSGLGRTARKHGGVGDGVMSPLIELAVFFNVFAMVVGVGVVLRERDDVGFCEKWEEEGHWGNGLGGIGED